MKKSVVKDYPEKLQCPLCKKRMGAVVDIEIHLRDLHSALLGFDTIEFHALVDAAGVGAALFRDRLCDILTNRALT